MIFSSVSMALSFNPGFDSARFGVCFRVRVLLSPKVELFEGAKLGSRSERGVHNKKRIFLRRQMETVDDRASMDLSTRTKM